MSTGKEVRLTFRGVDKTRAAFGRIRQNFKGMQKASSQLTRAVSGIGAGITAAFGVAAMKRIIDSGDKINQLSTRLGMSTRALSELEFVAKRSGVEFTALTTGMQRMTRRISEAAAGTGAAKDALLELGLSAQQLRSLAPEQQFEEIADALAGVENNSDKVRLAMKLFDTEGVALLQTMEKGAGSIREMREEAKKLGVSLSSEQAKSMSEFNASIVKLQFAVQGFLTQALLPVLPAITQFFSNTDTATKYLKIFAVSLMTVMAIKIAAWFMAAGRAVIFFSRALLASPIGRIAALIGLVVSVLGALYDKLKKLNPELAKTAENMLGLGDNNIKEPMDEHAESIDKLNESLQNNTALMEANNEQMRVYKEMLEANNEHVETLKEKMQNAGAEVENMTSNMDKMGTQLEEVADGSNELFDMIEQGAKKCGESLADSIADAAISAKGSVKSMSDIFDDFFNEIARGIIKSGIQSLLGGITGGLFGGGGFAGFFASGGRARPGKVHIVGDGGEPEIFIPHSSGQIVPFSKIKAAEAGSSNIVINMSVSTPDIISFKKSQSQIIADLARSIHGASRDL